MHKHSWEYPLYTESPISESPISESPISESPIHESASIPIIDNMGRPVDYENLATKIFSETVCLQCIQNGCP